MHAPILTRCPWPAAALLFLLAGCRQDFYRSETVLHADGRVDRAIYQPFDATPPAARLPELWDEIRSAPRIERDRWQGTIRDLPATARGDRSYLAAWGRFESAGHIPDHFLRPTTDGTQHGALERTAGRSDYGFVVEHRWSETLTDVIALDDLHQARRELAELSIALVEGVLAEALEPDYDTAPLGAWLRTQGLPWFEELTDVLVELGAKQELDWRDVADNREKGVLFHRISAVCARYGLTLEAGADPGKAFSAFAAGKLRELLRRRDGRPPEEEIVRRLLAVLNLGPASDADGSLPDVAAFEEAACRVIARDYGGPAALEARFGRLLTRVFGVYSLSLQPPERFDYTLTMPGTVVETTGTLIGENRIHWAFEADKAFPFGYPMTARSLAPDAALQRRVLGGEPVASRAALVEYVALVSEDERLRRTMRACAAEGSLAPFRQLKAAAWEDACDSDRAMRERIRRLETLLAIDEPAARRPRLGDRLLAATRRPAVYLPGIAALLALAHVLVRRGRSGTLSG